MNIAKMMKQAQQMQKKMGEMQAELATKEVQASVAGGKVTVVANGAGEVLSIKIDPAVVDPEDVEMLEDLVTAAVSEAQRQAKELQEREMGSAMGGMGNLGGML